VAKFENFIGLKISSKLGATFLIMEKTIKICHTQTYNVFPCFLTKKVIKFHYMFKQLNNSFKIKFKNKKRNELKKDKFSNSLSNKLTS